MSKKFLLLAISGKERLFVKKSCLSFVSCYAIFSSIKHCWREHPPSRFLKEKRRSVKLYVSKVLFLDIGKITNPTNTFDLHDACGKCIVIMTFTSDRKLDDN